MTPTARRLLFETTDLDAARDQVARTFADHDLTVRDSRALDLKLDLAVSQRIVVGRMSYGTGIFDGGGGWGDPFERDPERVLRDARDEYVSIEGAAGDYGVVLVEDPGDGSRGSTDRRDRYRRAAEGRPTMCIGMAQVTTLWPVRHRRSHWRGHLHCGGQGSADRRAGSRRRRGRRAGSEVTRGRLRHSAAGPRPTLEADGMGKDVISSLIADSELILEAVIAGCPDLGSDKVPDQVIVIEDVRKGATRKISKVELRGELWPGRARCV